MTENISYKRCVCDICNKEEHVPQSLILPKEWEKINIGRKSYDVCVECLVKVDMAIEDLKENKCEKSSKDDKPKTNADRIRRMSDKELADLLNDELNCRDCNTCEHSAERNCYYGGIYCNEHIFKWLQTEIK